jgi:hypothetical protein
LGVGFRYGRLIKRPSSEGVEPGGNRGCTLVFVSKRGMAEYIGILDEREQHIVKVV